MRGEGGRVASVLSLSLQCHKHSVRSFVVISSATAYFFKALDKPSYVFYCQSGPTDSYSTASTPQRYQYSKKGRYLSEKHFSGWSLFCWDETQVEKGHKIVPCLTLTHTL